MQKSQIPTVISVCFNYNNSVQYARKLQNKLKKPSLFYIEKQKYKFTGRPSVESLWYFGQSNFLHASKVWGFENMVSIEKMHLQFCKNILKVRWSITNYMVYGEIGRYAMELVVKRKILLFRINLLSDNNKLSFIL